MLLHCQNVRVYSTINTHDLFCVENSFSEGLACSDIEALGLKQAGHETTNGRVILCDQHGGGNEKTPKRA